MALHWVYSGSAERRAPPGHGTALGIQQVSGEVCPTWSWHWVYSRSVGICSPPGHGTALGIQRVSGEVCPTLSWHWVYSGSAERRAPPGHGTVGITVPALPCSQQTYWLNGIKPAVLT
ncbi:hypothetical protein ACOMHN_005333 [Nucella lapillus]